MARIAVIGAGGWGTAMAILLTHSPHTVTLYARRPEFVAELIEYRENRAYLPGTHLPDALGVTGNLQEAVSQADVVVVAVPSHGVAEIGRRLSTVLTGREIVVSLAKGLEKDTFLRMSQVLDREIPQIPNHRICALSGPNLAEEVSRGIPTATVIASMGKSVAVQLQEIFMAPALRVYTHHDMVGVEMGGALKNIIAIAVGISDGLGFGDNTRATLITRGLAEMARLGYAMGAELLTFAGLSGLGDLVCTCTSPHSRNHSVGIRIGQGEKLRDILAGTDMVIEGVKAAQVGQALSAHYGVALPITQETYRVLYEDKSPKDAVRSLMGREGKYEIEESRTERKAIWESL